MLQINSSHSKKFMVGFKQWSEKQFPLQCENKLKPLPGTNSHMFQRQATESSHCIFQPRLKH